jgi:hypothetical protein
MYVLVDSTDNVYQIMKVLPHLSRTWEKFQYTIFVNAKSAEKEVVE